MNNVTLGRARGRNFLFSTASLLLAPQVVGKGINANDHALGLVKNCNTQVSTTMAKLTQGYVGDVIDTQITGMDLKVTTEVLEYTTKNINYGMGLDTTNIAVDVKVSYPLSANLSGATPPAAPTITVTGDVTTSTDPIVQGSWVYIQDQVGSDVVFFSRVAAAPTVASGVSSIVLTDPLPSSFVFLTANGARLGKATKTDSNTSAMDTTFVARIIGRDKATGAPFALHFPRVKIMKGFAVNFSDKDYENMPFELDPLVPLPDDPGYSPDFPFQMSILKGMAVPL